MATITESIGRVLAGRYRIESALGSGASAHVFAAWDVTLRRRVAVKVLHPALATDSTFLKRFRAEAQSAASLSHPNVLAIYDWGEDGGGPFLVLEYLGGGSLRDILDTGRKLSVSQAVLIGIQAADGLAFAHARGFVHRDIKPANLLFGDDGRLRIGDFGLARALAEAAYTEPVGATVGTARYAAPEQAQGRQVDGKADVYSLSLALYEAVTGIVPFASDTTLATLMGRVNAPLPGHDALGPLSPVLADAAAPHAEERIDASRLAAALRGLTSDLPPPNRIPLVGPGGNSQHAPDGSGVTGVQGGDLTEIGSLAAPAPTGPTAVVRPTSTDVLDPALDLTQPVHPGVLDSFGAPGVEAAAPVGPWAAAPEPRGSGRRRRRGLWAAVIAVMAAILVAGASFAAVQTQLFVRSVALPNVTTLSTSQASSLLRTHHLSMQVLHRRSSLTVPAGFVLREIPAAGTPLKQGTVVQVVVSSGPPPVSVPSLSSLTGDCAAVTSLLAAAHLNASCTHQNSTTIPSGSVISWTPNGQAPEGSTVSVVVSSGPPMEKIPSLTGSTCQGATTALQAVGLAIKCTNVYNNSVPSGQVVNWNPVGQALWGSTVTVNISQGPTPVVVPNVDGHTVAQAIQMLDDVGLVPGSDQGPLNGHVFASNPAQGTTVPQGTTVTLYSS